MNNVGAAKSEQARAYFSSQPKIGAQG